MLQICENKLIQKDEALVQLKNQFTNGVQSKDQEILQLRESLLKSKQTNKKQQLNYQRQIKKITKLLKQLQQDFSNIRSTKEKAEERSSMLSTTLISQEELFKKEISQVKAENSTLRQQLSKLKMQYAQKQDQLDSLKRTLQQKENQISKIPQLKQKLSNIQIIHQKSQSEVTNLKQQIALVKQSKDLQNSKVKEQYEDLKTQVVRCSKLIERQDFTIHELRKRIGGQEIEKSRIIQEKNSLRSDYDKSNQLLKHLTQAHKQACSKLVQFDKILNVVKKENVNLKNQLNSYRDKESESIMEREEILRAKYELMSEQKEEIKKIQEMIQNDNDYQFSSCMSSPHVIGGDDDVKIRDQIAGEQKCQQESQ